MQALGQSTVAGSVKESDRTSEGVRRSRRGGVNVGTTERAISAAGGAIAALLGLARRDTAGLVVAAVGGGLLYRGLSGQCPLYSATGISTADLPTRMRTLRDRGVHFSESMLIDRTPEELYSYWRNLENLPRIMTHLKEVRILDARRSHWVAKAPSIAGGEIAWDAEIVADEPNQRIEWQSLPGSAVENRGTVQFLRAAGDRGTGVRVTIDYRPPAGQLGRWVAKLFGEEPEQQVWDDLRNFKRLMEVGEIPTIEGQSRGRCLKSAERHSP